MRRLAAYGLTSGAGLLLAVACVFAARKTGGLREAVLRIKGHALTVEIAATQDSRARGLMYRESLDQDRGMLFIYPEERILSFWMRNTTVPLSIAYLDAQGTIVEIRWMRPLDFSSTVSMSKVRYAIEANEDWFESKGIEPGERVGMPDWVKEIRGEP